MSTLATDMGSFFDNKSVSDSLRGVWDALVTRAIDATSSQWHKPAK
jgi:hypothetical protein